MLRESIVSSRIIKWLQQAITFLKACFTFIPEIQLIKFARCMYVYISTLTLYVCVCVTFKLRYIQLNWFKNIIPWKQYIKSVSFWSKLYK